MSDVQESQLAELRRLVDERDLYGLMLAAMRAWVKECQPDAAYACLVIHHREEIPATRISVSSGA